MQLRDHEAIKSKADRFRVDPRLLKVDTGFNVRDLDDPAERTELDKLKAELGSRWSDPLAQIPYMLRELREYGLYDSTCLATEAGSAARVFMLGYERPRNRNPAYRVRLARSIMERIGVQTSSQEFMRP